MQTQQPSESNPNIQIYLRNTKKLAYKVTIPRSSSTLYLLNLCSKIFKLQTNQLALYRAGCQVTENSRVELKDKEIVHVVNLGNARKQQITVTVKHGKSGTRFRVRSQDRIEELVVKHLTQLYQKEGMKMILVYIGKQLDQEKTFLQQHVEDQSQLFLFYVRQPVRMPPKLVNNPENFTYTQINPQQYGKALENHKDQSSVPFIVGPQSHQRAKKIEELSKDMQLQYDSDSQSQNPVQHLKQYEHLFNNPKIQQIAAKISPRVKQFYQKLGQTFLKHVKLNRVEQIYSETIYELLRSLSYNYNPLQSPYCSKTLTEYYQCKDCNQNNSQFKTCICPECFIEGDHQGHNFRLLSAQSAEQIYICNCGDKEYLKKQSFCQKHKGEDQSFPIPEQQKGDQQIFIREMQFVLYLFLKLKDISKGLMDQNKKKEIFAIHFVGKIGSFMSGSFINQNILASFLASKFQYQYPFCSKQQRTKSMLNLIFNCQKYVLFLRIFCIKLLLQMYCVKKVREIVITEYFTYANSSKTYLKSQNPISDIGLQYLSASTVVSQLLKHRKIKPLAIKHEFENFQQKSIAFLQMYQNYNYLLNGKNQRDLVFILLQRLNITNLYKYCSPKEEKLNKKVVLLLDIHYFKFLTKIIKIVEKHPSKQQILKKIIKESYFQLKSKEQSLSLSANRTFALALYAYLNYSLQNVTNAKQSQLLDLFSEISKDGFVQSVQLLLKKWTFITKIDNFNKYKEAIVDESKTYSAKVILSVDHIYLKLLFNILLRLQTSANSRVNLVLEDFVKKRQKVLGSLFQIFDSSDISRIEQTMDVMLSQIFIASNTILMATQSAISQTIAKDFLGQTQDKQISDIYQLLIYKNSSINVKQFKKDAQNCTQNKLLLKQFIKKDFNRFKHQINITREFVNVFNCSFNTYFLNCHSMAEIDALYSLKLMKGRRSNLSKAIFNDEMIKLIIRVTQWYLKVYQTSLKDNEVDLSKRLILVTFETLVTLYLQTLNRKVKETIDSLLTKPYLTANLSQYYKQIIEIYTSNNKKMEMEVNRMSHQERKDENALQQALKQAKKLLKKMEMKSRQLQTLQKHNLGTQVIQHAQKQQQKQICIVCKSESSNQKLNYLCYYRYSNLISQQLFNQNFPTIVITTCGHLIHQECLFNNLNTNELNLFDYQCFLCKTRSNTIIPAVNAYSIAQAREFVAYLQLIQHLVLQQSKGLIRILKQYQSMDFVNRIAISLIYQINGYSIHFPNFFDKHMFPVIKIAINFIKSMRLQMNLKDYFAKISRNRQQINFTCDQISKLISQNGSTFPNIEELVLKTTETQSLLYQLPEDLTDLNKEIGKCQKCLKLTSKLMICLLCKLKICEKCNQNNLEHLNGHFGQAAFVHVENGLCSYHFSNFNSNIGYLYQDYIGEHIKHPVSFAQKQQYILSKQLKGIVISDILNDEIPFKILEKLEQQRCSLQ